MAQKTSLIMVHLMFPIRKVQVIKTTEQVLKITLINKTQITPQFLKINQTGMEQSKLTFLKTIPVTKTIPKDLVIPS